jgi:hypothetical protein
MKFDINPIIQYYNYQNLNTNTLTIFSFIYDNLTIISFL